MNSKVLVIRDHATRCPCCGTKITIGATVRIKCPKELGQDSMDDYPTPDEGQEAGDG